MASDATIWEGPSESIPAVNSAGNIYEETHIAIAGQTVYNLLTFTYTPDTKTIFVVRDGFMLRRAVDFSETDSDTVTMALAATGGERVTFIAYAIAQVNPPVTLDGLPMGGTAGQVLTKNSGTDFDADWETPGAPVSLFDALRQDVASASTINLTGAIRTQTRNIRITGNTQIDGFQITAGELWIVKFASSLLLKNNVNIVTESGQDIQVSANDTCILRATATDTVEVISYSKASASQVPNTNDFRLTLTSGVSVTVADVAAASTIYCTPHIGNKISLYTGNAWKLFQSEEFSLALAGLTANIPYDVFCYDNAGTPTLETLIWATNTARATALSRQDGVYVKNGDPTRKYLGTFYALTATTTEDSEANRFLWNYYNRVNRVMYKPPVVAWSYAVAALRQAGGNVNNQLRCVRGVAEDSFTVACGLTASAAAAVNYNFGYAINSNAAFVAKNSFGISGTFNAPIGFVVEENVATIGLVQFNYLEQPLSAVNVSVSFDASTIGFTAKING